MQHNSRAEKSPGIDGQALIHTMHPSIHLMHHARACGLQPKMTQRVSGSRPLGRCNVMLVQTHTGQISSWC